MGRLLEPPLRKIYVFVTYMIGETGRMGGEVVED